MFRAAALFFATIATSPASAWDAFIDGPDVFGVTKGLAIEGLDRESLVIQCDSKDILVLAYVFKKEEFKTIETRPAKFFFQVDSGSPRQLDGELRSWNDNFGGVVVQGRGSPTLMEWLNAIKDAKGKINIGYEISGQQFSASFSSRGSTKAINQIIKACQLEDVPPA